MKGRLLLFGVGLTEAGGAAKRSNIFVRELAQRGWEIRGVTRASTLKRFRIVRAPGLRVLEVPGLWHPRIGAVAFVCLAVAAGALWGWKARLHLAIQLGSQSIAAAACSAITRRPYIAFLTTGGDVSELDEILSRRSASARRALLRRARFLVAQTDGAAKELSDRLGVRVEVLPNPVVTDVSGPSPEGKPTAAFHGRFSAEKDLSTLLDVWERIVSDVPDARLTLIGTGGGFRSVEDDIRRRVAASSELASTVVFTGWVSDPTPHLIASDLYVFPSLSEGMSNSLLEACAHRRIVVASNIHPNVEILGAAYPLLFEAGSGSDLEAKLRSALSDDRLRNAALAHIERVTQRFDTGTVLDGLEKLIEIAADSSRNQYTV